MKFPTPDYRGLATAPGFIVVATDFRWVSAFPVLKDDESDLNRMYKENAERILLQSVAAATMSAHLAAAALGYNVWWVTAIGQEAAQDAMKPRLGIPEELSVLDIMAFGPPAKKPYKRWRKSLADITNLEPLRSRPPHGRRAARRLDPEPPPPRDVTRTPPTSIDRSAVGGLAHRSVP